MRTEKLGYHKKTVIEPLVLEAEDYKNKPEKWNAIKELFGFNSTDKVSVIKAHVSSVEYFVEKQWAYCPTKGEHMGLRCWLYKLAVWYIGKCNKKWEKKGIRSDLQKLKRLTYHNIDKAYLNYGADAEWQNFSRYEVLDYAIQKLAMYEDKELNNN